MAFRRVGVMFDKSNMRLKSSEIYFLSSFFLIVHWFEGLE